MKKVILGVVVFVLLISTTTLLTGCDEESVTETLEPEIISEEVVETNEPVPTATPTPTPL